MAVGIDGQALRDVRIAIALGQDDLAIADDRDGRTGDIAAGESERHEAVQPGLDIGSVEPTRSYRLALRDLRVGAMARNRRRMNGRTGDQAAEEREQDDPEQPAGCSFGEHHAAQSRRRPVLQQLHRIVFR
ncbi:hypothetical protein [Sphingomonas sp. SRS2]|uniref:hypothetical protein n=1 Tax=Sphingomonas sp. SRS2 TaxID=133190 RepID=UPI001F43EB70|nr:hypothetical protein [Sphingomonas sp. SRS2]